MWITRSEDQDGAGIICDYGMWKLGYFSLTHTGILGPASACPPYTWVSDANVPGNTGQKYSVLTSPGYVSYGTISGGSLFSTVTVTLAYLPTELAFANGSHQLTYDSANEYWFVSISGGYIFLYRSTNALGTWTICVTTMTSPSATTGYNFHWIFAPVVVVGGALVVPISTYTGTMVWNVSTPSMIPISLVVSYP
jgi:hypothetical protein